MNHFRQLLLRHDFPSWLIACGDLNKLVFTLINLFIFDIYKSSFISS